MVGFENKHSLTFLIFLPILHNVTALATPWSPQLSHIFSLYTHSFISLLRFFNVSQINDFTYDFFGLSQATNKRKEQHL